MARELDQDELIDRWTLVDDELALVTGKRGATRVGFALLLRFYTESGQFPRSRSEIPDSAVEYVARQVGVAASKVAFYDWSGRTIKAHRVQIRRALGYRECTVADADKLAEWLVANVTQTERSAERVREELLARCREERIEQPTSGRVDRIVRSALHRGEELLITRVASRLPATVRDRLFALVATATDEPDGDESVEDVDGPAVLAAIRSEPGNVSLNTMLTEIGKLEAVRAVGLSEGTFADIAPKVVAAWRARAAVEAPSHLRDHAPEVRLTLLAALAYCREREITDTLVELLISTVHRINARAEVKVTKELIKRYVSAGNLRYYPHGEHIPMHRGLTGDWDALVSVTDTRGRRRVVRMV